MKLRTLLTPVAVSALALSACGGDADTPEVTTAPETSTQESTEEAVSEEPTVEETEAAEEETAVEESPAAEETVEETGEAPTELGPEARAALDAFLAKYEGSQEIPADQIDLEGAAEQADMFEVEPAECKDAMNSSMDPERMQNAVYGAAMAQDGAGGSIVLSVIEFPQGSDEARNSVAEGRDNIANCGELTMSAQGQSFQATLEELPGEVADADDSLISLSTVDMGGNEQRSYTGVASKDHVSATVVANSLDGSLDESHVQEALAESIAAMG